MTADYTRAYRGGEIVADGFPVSQVSEWLADPGVVVWVDYCGPTPDDLHQIATELGLHELAVEDALAKHQRPKLDHYPTHIFFSCHAASVNDSLDGLDESEINVFVNNHWIVTVRKDDGFPLDLVLERWERSPDLALHGSVFFLYGIIDAVIDDYFNTVQSFDDFYDEISAGIFNETPIDPKQQQHWFQMRQALVRFHRLAVPMREAVSALMRREHTTVPEAMYPYFQDVYDHILRVTEATDALRDLVATIVETNLSLRDYRQNQVMKKVTSWAAIIAVPTLITGFYGMNVPYPGFATHNGAYMSFGLMVALSLTLFIVFKRKEWL